MPGESQGQNWRGRRGDLPRVRHRWEEDWTELQEREFLAPPRRLQRRIFVFFVLAFGLVALFVYYMVYKPMRTPVLAVAATGYEWPVPPNAWAQEDVDGLRELDESNLRVVEVLKGVESKDQGLAEFVRQLRRLEGSARRNRPVLIHISMHGAVDERGNPCLIPTGTPPLRSSRWIPARDIIRSLKLGPLAGANKLLVLDCHRIRVNWRLGIIHNTFAERLKVVIEEEQVPNLVVLTSAAPDQVAWASSDLQGTVLGKYLKLGLAGAADLRGDGGGNGNGRVSVRELHRYLVREVGQWSRRNRCEPQTPQLIPSEHRDFDVTWAVNRLSLRSMMDRAESTRQVEDSVATEEIAQLWQILNGIQVLCPKGDLDPLAVDPLAVDPLAVDPIGVSTLEQQLIWLEQLSTAGSAYERRATQLHVQMSSRLARIEDRADDLQSARSVLGRARVLSDDATARIQQMAPHSLSLCECFSTLDAETLSAFREGILQLAAAPDLQQLDHLLSQFNDREALSRLAITQLFRFAARNRTQSLWTSSDSIRRALERRLRVEELATLGDVRVNRWIRPKIEALDPALRRAEDLLFAGEAASAGRESDASSLVNAYDEIVGDPLERVSHAVRQRDQTWSALPYFARWLSCPLPAGDDFQDLQQARDRLLVGPLRRAIDSSWRLGESLAARPNWETQAVAMLDELTQSTENDLNELCHEYQLACNALLDPSRDGAKTLREIDDVLTVPLIPWDKRRDLRRKRVALATQLSNMSSGEDSPPEESNEESEQPTGTSSTYSDRRASWDYHPLLALLQLESGDDANEDGDAEIIVGSALERDGERVRQRLDPVGETEQIVADDTLVALSGRELLSRAERTVRTAAALAVPSENDEQDPVSKLRTFDLQDMLLWHTGRVLDDFWGPMQKTDDRDGAVPFFELAASDYLDAVRALAPGRLENRVSTLRKQLNQYRIAARRGVDVAAQAAIQVDAEDQFSVNVTVSPLEKTVSQLAQQLPQGLATVFTRSLESSESGTRVTFDVPLTDQPANAELSGPATKGGGRAHEAVVFFRGHEYASPFISEGFGGVMVAYDPHDSDEAQVTLFGDRRKRSSVVFVLDCSSSMGELIPVEAVGQSELPRLTLAKGAMVAMLDQMAKRSDARVGVRFFGHRIGWSKSEPIQALVQQQYSGEIPENLAPSEDVELVLPLGRFDSVEGGRVLTRMRSVVPWGQSPLYLALLQSLNDFDREDPDTDKSIVVITDGENYQFTPAGEVNSAPPLTRESVLSAWEGKQVPVYIMGFGVSDDDEASVREFRAIADETRGEYYPVQSGRDLLRTLQSRLGLGRYFVEDDLGEVVSYDDEEPSVSLNTPVLFSNLSGQPAQFAIHFESLTREFELEGGESLEMFVTANGANILSSPYVAGLPVAGGLIRAGQAGRLVARAHQPTRQDSDVAFPISIQDESQHFTPRPREVWVEVTPAIQGQPLADMVYTFYGRNFEPNRPVPVLSWKAVNWPAEADQATIRLWCKFDDSVPVHSVEISDVVNDTSSYAAFRPVEGVQDVSYTVQVGSGHGAGEEFIKVVERHGDQSLGVNSVKVQLALADGSRARQVTHQFDAENGLAIHTYFFERGFINSAREPNAGEIRFLTRESVHDGAWRLEGDRPLTVNIFGAGDTLPLDAANGIR